MSIPGQLGFDIETPLEFRKDAFLFGESQSRVVVTVNEDTRDEFLDFVFQHNLPVMMLGHVTKGRMTVDEQHFGEVTEMTHIYRNAIGQYFQKK